MLCRFFSWNFGAPWGKNNLPIFSQRSSQPEMKSLIRWREKTNTKKIQPGELFLGQVGCKKNVYNSSQGPRHEYLTNIWCILILRHRPINVFSFHINNFFFSFWRAFFLSLALWISYPYSLAQFPSAAVRLYWQVLSLSHFFTISRSLFFTISL